MNMLADLCNVIRNYEREGLVARRNELFKSIFSECTYTDAEYYQYLTDYDWAFIFTLNIDDLVERVYSDQRKPLTRWLLSPRIYAETPSETVLVKLHGDIGREETYVFDDKEYENFTISNCWMLQKFADLYVDHDVIIIGTQFQEVDIKRALSNVFNHGCDNSNFNYFFISPGSFSRELQQEIDNRTNFYHIRMKADDFLTFIHEKIQKPTEAIQRLTSKGIVYWNKALELAGRETWELYHGNQPDPSDFVHSVDIQRKKELDDIFEFVGNNNYGIIEIKGSPYVGKTCLAERVLTEGYKKRFKAFYFPFVDSKQLRSFEDYINGLNPDDKEKIVVCFENSAAFYRKIAEIIRNASSHVHSFIAIATSNDMTKGPAGPIFGLTPFHETVVNERINGVLAKSIYEKLDDKHQLGKLLSYSEKGTPMVKFIRSINDIIDVLYLAHHGRHFTEYFTDWLKTARDENLFPVFQALTLLTFLGVTQINISLLPIVAEAVGCIDFDYKQFLTLFGSFCYEKAGRLCLRCSRLFGDTVLDFMDTINRKSTIAHLAEQFGSRLEEDEHSYYSDIFQHIVRASNLTNTIGLSTNEALDTLIDLRSKCNHLSYYWIQVGILYRNLSDFSNAENAFENAKDAHRKDNYQIAHARAKNYMEWGVWAVNHSPTQASEIFSTGANEMSMLQLRWKYPDAICFSMHSFVDMSLKYYSKTGIVPDEETWEILVKRTERYADNTNNTDSYLIHLIAAMKEFGAAHSLPMTVLDQLWDRMRIGSAVSITSDPVFDIDALPSYD